MHSTGKRGTSTYKPLEVLGPEHEFSIVNKELKALPIADKVIRAYCGKLVNFVELPRFTFGKEMQLHVIEVKANEPFKSPETFEETMHEAVTTLSDFLEKKYNASLLGTGMHPLLKLEDTRIWPHRHRKIYQEYGKVFNLKQHGWLNIQSYHLNLPYSNEANGVHMHNLLAILCAYLPAISASSPIYEGAVGANVDNRLAFYKVNQQEVPSVAGDVVPEPVSSFSMYNKEVIGRYSRDLAKAGADRTILFKEWVNSRGVIFRFDRSALEVRVMDEQECIKSDVALSCFVRASLRGLISSNAELLPHPLLVSDFNAVLANGLNAKVLNPHGPTARQVCKHLFEVAWENAEEEEKKFLPLVQKRIGEGNLSDVIKARVLKKTQRTDFKEAIVSVYSTLIKCLATNQPYF
ncbi:glutamate-cysteine ligase family protein [Candidatus Bathyarchaeota archaeon]|nr:glutamate-cysteine ligase family protein [Candidatus Bathyarchaeota archaeon]